MIIPFSNFFVNEAANNVLSIAKKNATTIFTTLFSTCYNLKVSTNNNNKDNDVTLSITDIGNNFSIVCHSNATSKDVVSFLFVIDPTTDITNDLTKDYNYIYIKDIGLFYINNNLDLAVDKYTTDHLNKKNNNIDILTPLLIGKIIKPSDSSNIYAFFDQVGFLNDTFDKNAIVKNFPFTNSVSTNVNNEKLVLSSLLSAILANTKYIDISNINWKQDFGKIKSITPNAIVRFLFPSSDSIESYKFVENAIKALPKSITPIINLQDTLAEIKDFKIKYYTYIISNVKLDSDGFKQYSRNDGTSGTFQSLKITYTNSINKDSIYFIVNTNNSDVLNIKKKMLTPNKVLSNTDNNENINFSLDLLGEVSKNISNILDKSVKSPETKKILISIINELITLCKENNALVKEGIFNVANNKLISKKYTMLSNGSIGNITLNIENIAKLLSAESSEFNYSDFKQILIDFGEVLGAIIFLVNFDNITIKFPSASNEKMQDYMIYVNDKQYLGVSAKAFFGASPSGSSTFAFDDNQKEDYIEALANTGKYSSEEAKDFLELFSNLYKQSGYNFVKATVLLYLNNIEHSSENKDIVNTIQDLLNKNSTVDQFANEIRKMKWSSVFDIIEQTCNMFGKTTLKKELAAYKNGDYTVGKNLYGFEQKYQDSIVNNSIFGYIIYPVYNAAAEYISNTYNDMLTSLMNIIYADLLQAYLNPVMKKNLLQFNVYVAGTTKWKFELGSVGRDYIFNQKISVRMIK